MVKFYEHLKVGMAVPVALNKAQLWLRQVTKAELTTWRTRLPLDPVQESKLDGKLLNLQENDRVFPDPYYWAAFCAIGL